MKAGNKQENQILGVSSFTCNSEGSHLLLAGELFKCLETRHQGMSHEASLDQLKNMLASWTNQIIRRHFTYLGPQPLVQVKSQEGNNQPSEGCLADQQTQQNSAQWPSLDHHCWRAVLLTKDCRVYQFNTRGPAS